jgi:hypothetical protein
MQWPFAAWGADLVLSAHDHNYERLSVGGLTYLVAGTGGAALRAMNPLVPGSIVAYNEAHGALLITANAASIRAEFHSVDGGDRVIDCVAIGNATCNASPSPAARPAAANPAAALIARRIDAAHSDPPRRDTELRAARSGASDGVERTRRNPSRDVFLTAQQNSRHVARRSMRSALRLAAEFAESLHMAGNI